MLLILLSPFIALVADFVRQKFSISKTWTAIIVLIMTIPSLLVWLTGFTYSDQLGNNLAITIFVSGIIFAVYSYNNSGVRSKIMPTIMLFFIIGIFILFFYFTSIFSQHTDKIYSVTNSKHYKAIHSRDFDMVLSGLQRVTIKKKAVYGLIEKTIYNETLPNPDTIPNCMLYIIDRNKKISFDYCKNVIAGDE